MEELWSKDEEIQKMKVVNMVQKKNMAKMQFQMDNMQKQMDKYSQSRTQWKQIAEE